MYVRKRFGVNYYYTSIQWTFYMKNQINRPRGWNRLLSTGRFFEIYFVQTLLILTNFWPFITNLLLTGTHDNVHASFSYRLFSNIKANWVGCYWAINIIHHYAYLYYFPRLFFRTLYETQRVNLLHLVVFGYILVLFIRLNKFWITIIKIKKFKSFYDDIRIPPEQKTMQTKARHL